jgi:hypothetical protein
VSDIIFARPRHNYDSYQDVYALIRLSGYPLVYVDEIDASDPTKTYVLTPLNGEWQHGWPDAKATIIHYDLEWRLDGPYPQIPGVRRTWAADAWYARRVGAEYVPLGSHPDLRLSAEPADKRYDAALLAYMGPPRRQQVAHDLRQHGITLAPNAWGEERDGILRSTRLVAHVHQHEGVRTVAPGRFALAAAYGLPLVTETLDDPGIFTPGTLLQSDAAHYADFTRMWLGDEAKLRDFGASLHWLLCREHTFRRCVDQAV